MVSRINGFNRLARKIVAMLLSALLTIMLCPVPAHAVGFQAAGEWQVQKQDKKQSGKKATVYVLSKIIEIDKGDVNSPGKTKTTFSYNKKGLIAKEWHRFRNSTNGSVSNNLIKWSYDENCRLKQGMIRGTYLNSTRRYHREKNGRLKSISIVSDRARPSLMKVRYSYRHGKIVAVRASDDLGMRVRASGLSYKHGKLVRFTNVYGSKCRVIYDRQGNVKRQKYVMAGGSVKVFKHVNKYRHGRLVKSFRPPYSISYSYAYKRMKVDARMVGKIKAQQWSLLNDDLTQVFGYCSTLLY